MAEREIIEERLRRKEAEIQTLEDKLRSARVYVQALRDVLKAVDSEPANEDGRGSPSEAADNTLRPGSAVAQAREIILKRGVPVHIAELLSGLGRQPTREGRASLTSSLSAYVRRGEIFSRPAPNTFGLIELGHSSSVPEPILEPPSGFGRNPELLKAEK